jgi:hypothetical protein
MTVGKDVSMLFTDVVNCMQTENLELKKLVYLYLINYAKSQPDLAILAVNTFVKVSSLRRLEGHTLKCQLVLLALLVFRVGAEVLDHQQYSLLQFLTLESKNSDILSQLLEGMRKLKCAQNHAGFLQDSQDPNPLIRALAVRTMGCIRVDKITEYLCDPLQKCLKVRRTRLKEHVLDLRLFVNRLAHRAEHTPNSQVHLQMYLT